LPVGNIVSLTRTRALIKNQPLHFPYSMTADNPRDYSRLAVAIVIAALVIGISIIVSPYLSTRTVTQTTTTTQSTTLTETIASITTITTTPATTSAQPVTVGGVTFSGSWHYVGNVTLTGALSTCKVLGIPCPSAQSQAEAFTDGFSTIYAEYATLIGVQTPSCFSPCTTTVLIMNNAVFCITPYANGIAPLCPSMIDGS